jgi:hypothetical protein
MKMVVALAAVGVLCPILSAASNPQVALIHEQIKLMKAEEKTTLTNIQAWYEGMVKRDKLTAAVIEEERKNLKAQEDALLSKAATEMDKAAIHAHFDGLRVYLKEDYKMDAAAIKELRALEKTHKTHVATVYKAQIQNLEAAAKAAAKMK